MKFTSWAYALAFAGCLLAGNAKAQSLRQPLSVRPAAFDYEHYLQDDASPSDAPVAAEAVEAPSEPAPAAEAESVAEAVAAGSGAMSSCNSCAPVCNSCAPSCSPCASSCCNSCGIAPACCLGDAWTLSDKIFCEGSAWTIGGWTQLGYHSESTGLFNNRPDELNLHQQWLYLEKTASPTACCLDWGFRADIMYGIDGTDTQAFGNDPGEWDYVNGFDHGAYSWAIPQLYGEIAGEDWSVKAGHFYTSVGYEVVTAPDNFFYSHAMTMFLSEPFTHTGFLATKTVNDCLEVFGGWTMGWDTGFDEYNGTAIGLQEGSSFLGGFSATLTDDITFIYTATAGDFGWRGDDAYSHSLVFDVSVTDNLNYVLQSDCVRVDQTGEDNVGINQYFLYTVNDCLGLGARLEWWKGDSLTGYAPHGGVVPATGSHSYYATTFGANYKPHANVVIRPEVRFDWSPAVNYDETIFGIDAIFTF